MVLLSCSWFTQAFGSASQCFSSELGSFQALFLLSISFFTSVSFSPLSWAITAHVLNLLILSRGHLKLCSFSFRLSRFFKLDKFYWCVNRLFFHLLSDVSFSREYLISVIVLVLESQFFFCLFTFFSSVPCPFIIKTLFLLSLNTCLIVALRSLLTLT